MDAQLPRRLAGWLAAAGCDAIHTLDLPDRNRTTDQQVIDAADREQRAVVTKDADFVDSHILHARPCAMRSSRPGTSATGNWLMFPVEMRGPDGARHSGHRPGVPGAFLPRIRPGRNHRARLGAAKPVHGPIAAPARPSGERGDEPLGRAPARCFLDLRALVPSCVAWDRSVTLSSARPGRVGAVRRFADPAGPSRVDRRGMEPLAARADRAGRQASGRRRRSDRPPVGTAMDRPGGRIDRRCRTLFDRRRGGDSWVPDSSRGLARTARACPYSSSCRSVSFRPDRCKIPEHGA